MTTYAYIKIIVLPSATPAPDYMYSACEVTPCHLARYNEGLTSFLLHHNLSTKTSMPSAASSSHVTLQRCFRPNTIRFTCHSVTIILT